MCSPLGGLSSRCEVDEALIGATGFAWLTVENYQTIPHDATKNYEIFWFMKYSHADEHLA